MYVYRVDLIACIYVVAYTQLFNCNLLFCHLAPPLCKLSYPYPSLQVYEQQVYEQQAYEQQAYEQQVYEQQAYEQQVYEQQAYEQQAYEQQAYEQQVYEQQVYEQQACEWQVYEQKVYEYQWKVYQRQRQVYRQQRYLQQGCPPMQQVPVAPSTIQQQTNVVVVSQEQQVNQPTVIHLSERKSQVNHVLHLIIILIFPPWVFVWIALCLIFGA